MCLTPKTLHYAKLWAQNATKTSAGNIPESLSNLFLRDNCRLSQRLLNNAKKRTQRLTLTFWVRRLPGGVGVFPAKGWWSKSSCPPSKVSLPWVSKGETWDVPGILLGCPVLCGCSKTLCGESLCAHLSVPNLRNRQKLEGQISFHPSMRTLVGCSMRLKIACSKQALVLTPLAIELRQKA